jgi:hypothetical protein
MTKYIMLMFGCLVGATMSLYRALFYSYGASALYGSRDHTGFRHWADASWHWFYAFLACMAVFGVALFMAIRLSRAGRKLSGASGGGGA